MPTFRKMSDHSLRTGLRISYLTRLSWGITGFREKTGFLESQEFIDFSFLKFYFFVTFVVTRVWDTCGQGHCRGHFSHWNWRDRMTRESRFYPFYYRSWWEREEGHSYTQGVTLNKGSVYQPKFALLPFSFVFHLSPVHVSPATPSDPHKI